MINKHGKVMHQCNLCGRYNFEDRMTYDEKFGGWVDWSCKVSWEREEREDQRYEEIQDKMRQEVENG